MTLITKCARYYYKMRQKFITKCDSFVKKCDSFVTKCNNFNTEYGSHYKMRRLLQIATVKGVTIQQFLEKHP